MVEAYVALGANLPGPHGPPEAGIRAAAEMLHAQVGPVRTVSSLWRGPPWPQPSDQPWYVNAVAWCDTALTPAEVLAALKAIEAAFGRDPGAKRNAARPMDLDLIDHGGAVLGPQGLVLPHPRMAVRGFVLRPLAEVAPDWTHPVSGASVAELIAALAPEESLARL